MTPACLNLPYSLDLTKVSFCYSLFTKMKFSPKR